MVGVKGTTVTIVVFMLVVSNVTIFLISTAESGSNANGSFDIIEGISYTFSFNSPILGEKVVYNSRFATVDVFGCRPFGRKAGEPVLPVKFVKLLLPPGTSVKNIEVIGIPLCFDPLEDAFLEKPIIPYQYPLPIGSIPSNICAFDGEVYTSMDYYPSNIYENEEIGYCRGYTILSLALSPVQYTPGIGRLVFYPNIIININLEEDECYNPFYRFSVEDENWVKNLVSNPEMADNYGGFNLGHLDYSGGLCDPSDNYDYVIITTTNNGLNYWETSSTLPYNWTSLMDKHATDDGLSCTLVTIQDIDDCSNYWNETALFNDSAAHIREFCKDAYQDWGASYIFIGGDDEWIPARHMKYAYESNVDSDLYWSNLDNTFNDDEDEYWGEEGDAGFDLYSELYVGRITCDEPQDVSNWMNKSFYYADSFFTDYLDSAAFYGGATGWSCEGDDFIEYSAINGTDDWLGPSPGDHGSYPSWLGFMYGFETWNSENPGVEYNLSVKWTADFPNTGWSGGDESSAIAGLKDAINNDRVTLISTIAHANEHMSMDVYDTSWESDYHNTKPFFLHDYGCHCGDMDAADDGVLHSMLFHSDTELAFACVYNTCYGWGSFSDTNSSSALQQKLFWDYMFDTTNNSVNTMNWQLGKAMAWSKDSMAPTINWTYAGAPGSWRAVIQGCLLFGDPAQRIKPPTLLGHNVRVKTLDVSASNPVKPNETIYVNTTAYNNGANNETDVLVSFRINGSQVNTTNISFFESQTSQDVSFNWTPSAGVYTVTINITIPGVTEDSYLDNEKNKTVIVGIRNIDTNELFDTIQEAINDSDTLDEHSILVPLGTYHENVMVNKNISLIGTDKDTTIIECNNSADSVIQIQNRHNVNITKFTIRNGTYGVYVDSSSNITLTDNIIFDNNLIGIYLNASENTTITSNEISNSTLGVNLTNSSNNNTFTENDIVNNDKGLRIGSGSNYNSIYHNNLNNTQNAIDDGNNNLWDNGCLQGFRLRGGNWWSNYTGIDADGDGLGDTPYNISGINNSQDRYPLMEQWIGSLSGTIYVDDDNNAGPWDGTMDHPYQYIQDGVDAALGGDTVFVNNGTYYEKVTVDKSVNLTGEDKNITIIDGSESGTVVSISANSVNISGFTIQNAGNLFFDYIDWTNISDFIIQNDSISEYYVGIHVSSNYNKIYGNIIADNFCGILWLEELSNNNISYNTIKNNDYDGVIMGYSSDNIIVGNNITNNTYFGIDFGYSSNNTIVGNTITNNDLGGGIRLFDTSNTAVFNNTITEDYFGIYSSYSSNNNISMNNITNNSYTFYLYDSYNNNITGNTIADSLSFGIHLFWSDDNYIYHNDFVNNDQNAFDDGTNTWDNGYPFGGNYWDNYTGIDTDGDGIGDTAYSIQGGDNQDRYPLIYQWGTTPPLSYGESPSNNSVNVDILQATINITIRDLDSITFNWTIEGTYVTNVGSNDDTDGVKSANLITPLPYDTEIVVYVNATDGLHFTNETYNFTTRSIYVVSPPSNFVAYTHNKTQMNLSWVNGENASHTYIERNMSQNWTRGEGVFVYNGTGTSTINSSLLPNTCYYYQAWSWNETDNVWSVTNVTATNITNRLPRFSSESPTNGSTGVSTGTSTLTITIQDPDGDQFNWSITTSPNVGSNSGTNASNGTKSCSISGLGYDTPYYWYVSCEDVNSSNWANATYHFMTRSSSGNGGTPPGNGGGQTAPNTPTITGPAEGYTNVIYSYTANTTDPDGHDIHYNFSWGDETYSGWTNPAVGSGIAVSETHKWLTLGTYEVKAKAKDASDDGESGWSSLITVLITELINNTPPNTPSIPYGPTEGLTNNSYSYLTVATDPDDDKIQFRFNWGDGTISNWTALISSGTTVSALYIWTNFGNYSITAQARDSYNITSSWSDPLNITMVQDSDGDGWSDEAEIYYGTNAQDADDCPVDTDGDRIPDDYDDDDDGDGLEDHLEKTLGSNPKDNADVLSIELDGTTHFLIDTDGDGQSDIFYNSIGRITTVKTQKDGTYLIDVDGDDEWDYIYDPASGIATPYEETLSQEFPWLILLITVIVVAVIIIIVVYRRR